MAKRLKLGVIGMSEGNGHPYSWSSIFNGYDKEAMSTCPFPVIPEYLGRETFPDNFLNHVAEVTHIWTQDKTISAHVAKAARIRTVCDSLMDMLGEVDAVFLARDDAEHHYQYAKPYLEAGIPVYIDKPFALSLQEANNLWNLAKNDNQIFTCSALQFAKEYQPAVLNGEMLGEIKAVWATVPKSWEKYAVHIIEPVLNLLPERGELVNVKKLPMNSDDLTGVQVQWSTGIIAQFQTGGKLPVPLSIKVLGTKGVQELKFEDTFYAFKSALKRFIGVVKGEEANIPRAFTQEMVTILEAGSHA
ncbi:MAG: Gfo/Idh/MocA family oxidoreductase [Bacteroidetes bacterium]|nr:MAG: Gfo/Idh/MocA family oxidoreductase [Bacteroidota bacterium]